MSHRRNWLRSLAGVRSSRGRVPVAMADQVASSLSNFVLVSLAARTLDVREFGAFGAIILGYSLVIGIQRAAVMQPYTVELRGGRGGAAQSVLGAPGWAALGVAAGLLIAIGATSDKSYASAAIILATGAYPLLLQDAHRYLYLAQHQPWSALVMDLAWLGVSSSAWIAQFAGAVDYSLDRILVVWCLGATAGILVNVKPGFLLMNFRMDLGWLSYVKGLGRQFLADFILGRVGGFFVHFFIIAQSGMAIYGLVREAEVLMAPVASLLLAGATALLPEFADISTGRHRARAGTLVSGVLAICALSWTAIAVYVPAVRSLLIGRESIDLSILYPVAGAFVAASLASGAAMYLKSDGRGAALTIVRGAMVAVSVAGGSVSYSLWGFRGMLWALVAANALAAALWWTVVIRSLISRMSSESGLGNA